MRRIFTIIAVGIALIAATNIIVSGTGDEIAIGGDASPVNVDGDTTADSGLVLRLAVVTRPTIVGDKLGLGGLWSQLSRTVDSTATADELAELDTTLADAWAVAQRHCTPLCENTGRQPDLNLSGNAVGGSVGLAATLAYLDHITTGDLTGGLTVAATGVIVDFGPAVDTPVIVIGGLEHKLPSAERAGAQLALIPTDNAGDNTGEHPGMTVVEVGTVNDAVDALCDHGSSVACQLADASTR